MPKTLGEFEQLILFALLDLNRAGSEVEAYGVTVRRKIESRTGRAVSSGAVYTALDRLEAQGLVSSHEGAPSRERGGRRKRLIRLEEPGLEALGRSVATFQAMSKDLLPVLQARLGEDGRGATS